MRLFPIERPVTSFVVILVGLIIVFVPNMSPAQNDYNTGDGKVKNDGKKDADNPKEVSGKLKIQDGMKILKKTFTTSSDKRFLKFDGTDGQFERVDIIPGSADRMKAAPTETDTKIVTKIYESTDDLDNADFFSYHAEGNLEGGGGGGGESSPTWWAADVRERKIRFLDSNNEVINPSEKALNISNEVTTKRLPKKSNTDFSTTSDDSDNFRIEVIDPGNKDSKVQVDLLVRNGNEFEYELSNKKGDKYRGPFLRLVGDSKDAQASKHGKSSDPDDQTIKPKSFGKNIKISYKDKEKIIRVARPKGEDNNGSDHLLHDIRELKVRVVVFNDPDTGGTVPLASASEVNQDLRVARERLSQASIRLDVVERVNLEMPDPVWDGYTTSTQKTENTDQNVTDDEKAVRDEKDGNPDTIDIFYVGKMGEKDPPEKDQTRDGIAYFPDINSTTKDYDNFFVIEEPPGNAPLVFAHEFMHILLNSIHKKEDHTYLFNPILTNGTPVLGTKRIGPYSVQEDDETITIRKNAEDLP